MSSEIRFEDLGKMMLKDAPVIETKVITDILNEFFKDTKNSIYLLYGREVNYFTVVKNTSFLETKSTEEFINFTIESTFNKYSEDKMQTFGMNEIVEIEYNKNINAVELWIGQGHPVYFQLMPWDDSTVII